MTVWDQNVLLVVSDPALKEQLLGELVLHRPSAPSHARRGHYQVTISGSLDEALARQLAAADALAVVVLDQSALGPGVSLHAQWDRVRELAAQAPVVLIMETDRVQSLNGLAEPIAGGRIEMVYRSGSFVPLVMALIARHAAAGRTRQDSDESFGPNFGEAFRHELNNPLTGILGNAELLLAHRDRLPAGAAARLKAIADLAVHLRETVRRLSNAWEEQSARTREVEVGP